MNLIHILASDKWADTERHALDVCRHFRDRGWNVTALTRDAKAVDSQLSRKGIALTHAPLQGYFDFTSVWRLSGFLKTLSGDVVIHTHRFADAFTALAARRLSGKDNIRIVHTRHNVKRGRNSALMRRIYRNLDAILFVSGLARERFLSTWRGRELPFPDRIMETLLYSVPARVEPVCDVPRKGPATAVFISRVSPGCGLETLIDALSIIKADRIRLRILTRGNSDYIGRMRQRAVARGVDSLIDWKKNDADMTADIDACLFGVFPTAKEKSTGIANLLLMSRGRAQICTRFGARAEYLTEGEDSLCVAVADTAALAETIRSLASDRERCSRMGHNALQAYRTRFSWASFISRLADIYTTPRF